MAESRGDSPARFTGHRLSDDGNDGPEDEQHVPVIEPWWKTLLRQLQDSRFADIAGAEGAVKLPIADTLVTAIVQQRLPPSFPISELEFHAQADDHFILRVKLKSPAFLPAFTIRFVIASQPALPEWPCLRVALASQGMSALFGTLVRAFASLPRWLRLDEAGQITADLGLLAAEHGLDGYFRHLAHLEVRTVPGRVLVSVRAVLEPPS